MAGTTYRQCRVLLLSVALMALSVLSQTVTTTDALGETIVEVITLDPQLGLPTTQIVETLTGALTTPITTPLALPTTTTTNPLALPTTTTTTTPPVAPVATTTTPQQGPVGAPPASTAAGPTVYTYTTTNAEGATIGVVDTFTPIFAPSTPYTPVSTGTVLQYSQWLSMVGGTSAAAAAANELSSGSQSLSLSGSWLFTATGCLAGIMTGVWVVLA